MLPLPRSYKTAMNSVIQRCEIQKIPKYIKLHLICKKIMHTALITKNFPIIEDKTS